MKIPTTLSEPLDITGMVPETCRACDCANLDCVTSQANLFEDDNRAVRSLCVRLVCHNGSMCKRMMELFIKEATRDDA